MVYIVATLALARDQGKGVASVRAYKWTRESHHMLSGVQRVWGSEPSHSQMKSHVGSWWELESQKDSRNFRERFEASKRNGLLRSL
jgi:hypothetical protein